MRAAKLSLIILLGLMLASCTQYKPISTGSSIEVATLVSSDLWEKMGEDLKTKVELTIKTPQTEQLFYFTPMDLKMFSEHKRDANILFVATLDRNDKISNFIKKGLDESVLSKVRSGEKYLFVDYNKTAQRQTYMLLIAADTKSLKEYVQTQGRDVYDALNKGFLSGQFDEVYARAEEVELSEEIFDKLGFSFRIPHDYEIIELDTTRRILHLGRAKPQRNIIVTWQNGGFNKVLSRSWALKNKMWLMNYQMDGIYIERSYARYRQVDWNGVAVNNIRGLWGHPTKTMGGPFSAFYFYDGVTNRTYFIDNMLYAPGRAKAVYLRQMEIISSTFYTSR